MKTLTVLSALALSASLFACDKTDKKAEESAKTTPVETTTAKVEKTEATKTAAAAAPAEEPGHECGAAEGKTPAEHEGMDCMKKTAEMAAMGEGEGGCNKWDDAADKIAKQEVPADAQWSVLAVTGMTCGGCERRIIANVGKLDGILAVEADSELGQVRVAFAAGDTKASDAARTQITELGYKLQ